MRKVHCYGTDKALLVETDETVVRAVQVMVCIARIDTHLVLHVAEVMDTNGKVVASYPIGFVANEPMVCDLSCMERTPRDLGLTTTKAIVAYLKKVEVPERYVATVAFPVHHEHVNATENV
jgi:hypothetical protein